MTSLNFLPSEVSRKNEEFEQLQLLLQEISMHELSENSTEEIRATISALLNSRKVSEEENKAAETVKNEILELLRKEHGLVPESYYTNLWLPLGMSAFGLPVGVVFFAATDNPAFIALGLPLGLGLGTLYGAHLDKKAEAEGKVLKFQKTEKKK